MSTMMQFAVEEGKLNSPDDLIYDWNWGLTAADQSMTFRHLANMTSGYARAEAPGQTWAYNDYAINLYAKTVFDRVFDEGSPNDAATNPSRLGALQFEDGSIFSSRGGYGVSTSPRDFARIGWFWLNKGNWDGQQLLPETFFDQNMQAQVPASLPRTTGATSDYLGVGSHGGGSDQTPHGPGFYGFNWWFNPNQAFWPDAPADTFQANGHWNKEIVTVVPSLNMVVAARGTWGTFDPGNAASTMNQNLKLLVEAINTNPGDFDFDGDVDGVDFLKWRRGESPNPLSALDLADWEANYGTASSLSAIARTAAEPSSGALWFLAWAISVFSPPRKQKTCMHTASGS